MNKVINMSLALSLVVSIFWSCKSKQVSEKTSKQVQTDQYLLDNNWPKIPMDFVLGNPTGLSMDNNGNIVVFHRASQRWTDPMPETNIQENTISTFDAKTGELLDSWGKDLFVMPHGLEIDQNNNIWVTDVALHQVFKFDADHRLVLTLGEARVPGDDRNHFNLPTDVAVAADGSFYVSDGYGNSRVVKFSKDGEFLFEWGKHGKEPGEFDTPHGIDLDDDGNVYVADRENNRIQKFDENGVFISLWQNEFTEQLYSVVIDHQKDHLFGIDYISEGDSLKGSDIFRFNLDFVKQLQFGRSGFYDGPVCRYHDVQLDREGNIYVGDILGNRVQKFRLVSKEY